ncbi:hypothetical protein [Hymenobacter cavernae]|uniref:Uncharacterized protein n=1 Tax=Hymenobacter cavernae TaxID=2044852 RepID=A0ABQ1UPA3_9BACT|nr:hypothetical protein [Hymenobacter cavernae]GGF21828.1 hypothetical protein GCM10011383_36810 [Hymenobacter cavernae]
MPLMRFLFCHWWLLGLGLFLGGTGVLQANPADSPNSLRALLPSTRAQQLHRIDSVRALVQAHPQPDTTRDSADASGN